MTDLIVTHRHHDHTECISAVPNAVVYVQRQEYEKPRRYIGEGQKVVLFDEGCSVCPGVTAVKIGGHTEGSSVVEIEDGVRTWVLAGDECYLKECLEKQIPTGQSRCPERSQYFIDTYCRENVTVLLAHDQ